jgi:hypothetical protein
MGDWNYPIAKLFLTGRKKIYYFPLNDKDFPMVDLSLDLFYGPGPENLGVRYILKEDRDG